jgi:hypothetical protein
MFVGKVPGYKDESLLTFVRLIMFYPTVKHLRGGGNVHPSPLSGGYVKIQQPVVPKALLLFYFILKSKSKMKVCHYWAAFLESLSWNGSRSLCPLSVLMCYVYSIPSSHISLPRFKQLLGLSFWLLLPLALASSPCW